MQGRGSMARQARRYMACLAKLLGGWVEVEWRRLSVASAGMASILRRAASLGAQHVIPISGRQALKHSNSVAFTGSYLMLTTITWVCNLMHGFVHYLLASPFAHLTAAPDKITCFVCQ